MTSTGDIERLQAVALAAQALVRSVQVGYALTFDTEVVSEAALTALESALAEAGYDLTDEELAQSEEQRGG